MFDLFRNGGIFSYIILSTLIFAYLVSAVTALSHFTKPKKPKKTWMRSGLVLLFTVFFSLAIATGAYYFRMSQVENALQISDPAKRQMMITVAMDAASAPLKMSMANILPFVMGIFSLLRGFLNKNETRT